MGHLYSVRGLSLDDLKRVKELDEMSGNGVSQWVEDLEPDEISDYAYGLFKNRELVGYATVGYADDVCPEIQAHPEYHNEQLLLSDVFIEPIERHQGLGRIMVFEAIWARLMYDRDATQVYANLMCDNLMPFYKTLGFQWCNPDDQHYVITISREDFAKNRKNFILGELNYDEHNEPGL